MSFLENKEVVEILRQARVVWLAWNREWDEAVQRAVDAANARQRAKVESILDGSPRRVKVWVPPDGVKDIAEHLQCKSVRKKEIKIHRV
jgi:hypothetical protein